MKKVSIVLQGVYCVIEEHAFPLLSVSPMDSVNLGNSNEDDDESTSFDIVTHLRHFESASRIYDVDIHD